MAKFKGKQEGAKLLALLETGITPNRRRPNIFPQEGENPLYEFKSGEHGNGYSYPAMQKVFELLGRNGYGGSYIQKAEEDLKNGFRAGLNSCDPSWIYTLDMAMFDKLVYFFNFQNNKGMTPIHYIPERLCDGTVKALLERAMELGSFEPAPRPCSLACAPAGP
jgi:hypothetical protein